MLSVNYKVVIVSKGFKPIANRFLEYWEIYFNSHFLNNNKTFINLGKQIITVLTALLYNVIDKVVKTYLYYTCYLEVIFKSQEEWIKEQVT